MPSPWFFDAAKTIAVRRADGIPHRFQQQLCLRRHVLNVGRNVPMIAESVLHSATVIAVGLVLKLGNGSRSRGQRAPVQRVAIGNIQYRAWTPSADGTHVLHPSKSPTLFRREREKRDRSPGPSVPALVLI